MGNAIYTIGLFALIFMIIKLESIKKYCNKFLKACSSSSDKKRSYTSEESNFSNNMENGGIIAESSKSGIADCESGILENIGYFVASNDEKKTTKYCPTSLQDIDPNGLA